MSILPKQITGAFFYVGGSPLAGAQLTLVLSQSAVLNDGSGSVATPEYIVTLGSDGTIPSATDIYYNDDLLPNGTYYTWQIVDVNGVVIFGPVSAQIVGTAPVNLNTTPPLSNVIQPTPAPSAFGPLTVVQPTGTNLHVVVDSGASGASASSIAAAIVSNPPTVDIKSTTITALTPPTASAIGAAVAAPSASAIGTAVADDLLIGTQAAGSSVPVALPSATITALTPPSASAIGSAVAAPSASAIASALSGVEVTNAGTFAVQLPTLSAIATTRSTVKAVSVKNTGSSGTLIGAVSSVYNDILGIVLTNETATATVVSISDGTATYKFALAANGGGVFQFPYFLPATSLDTNWTISNSASSTVDAVVTYVANA